MSRTQRASSPASSPEYSCYRRRCRAPNRGARGVPFLPCTQQCVRVSGFPPHKIRSAPHMSTFADLGVTRPVADALAKRGIKAPFAVQKMVIEDVFDGHDVLVQSPTGSGKTLAFAFRSSSASARRTGPQPRSMLAPTRELALQIEEELETSPRSRPSRRLRLRRRRARKAGQAAARAHILVATPGRLEDLLDRRAFAAQRAAHPRHRRGGPDARHGLQARGRPDRRRRRRTTARPCSSPPRSRLRPARSPAAYTYEAERHVNEPVE